MKTKPLKKKNVKPIRCVGDLHEHFAKTQKMLGDVLKQPEEAGDIWDQMTKPKK